MFNNSGPLTDMKLIPASLATALARRVLPQPGGPQIRIPAGAVSPNCSNCFLYLTGPWYKKKKEKN